MVGPACNPMMMQNKKIALKTKLQFNYMLANHFYLMAIPKKIITSIAICCLVSGCLFDSGSDNITERYNVTWIDVHISPSIEKGETLVPAYVFAAGHDINYIYAKQHPVLWNNQSKLDMAVTKYYIIVQTEYSFQDKPTYGPLRKNSSTVYVVNWG